MNDSIGHKPPQGAQRLSLGRLNAWRALDYGMFIHYGMATFSTENAPGHYKRLPLDRYAPTNLDVDQWVRVARDAGMRYIILTTKHCGGFALWPTKFSEYGVAHSNDKRDVVGLFVDACAKYKIKPVFYYAGEGVNDFGIPARTETDADERRKRFMEYCLGQLEELLTGYGPVEGVWFDGSGGYGREGRQLLYDTVVRLQPDAVVTMNHGFEDHGIWMPLKADCWPTDIRNVENGTPPYAQRTSWYWADPAVSGAAGWQEYYLPCEAAMQMDIGGERWWFGGPSTKVYSDAELLALRLLCRERNATCVFNVPPTPEGRFRQDFVDALMRLRENMEKFETP